MKNKYQIPTWFFFKNGYWKPFTPVIALLIFFFLFIGGKAENVESPSCNLATFSGLFMNPDATWFEVWTARATATFSGTNEYFPYADSQMFSSYQNWTHILVRSDEKTELEQWMTDHSRHPQDAFMKWQVNTCQKHDLFHRFVPGWDPVNDGNNDYSRDSIADYNSNWNATEDPYFGIIRFTTDNANGILTDTDGGMWFGYYDGGGWTSDMWAGAILVLGYGTDADTIMATVDSSDANNLYCDRTFPSQTYTWYVVDRGDDYRSCAMSDTVARTSMYFYCEEGLDGCGSSYSRYNQICTNHGDSDVRNYWTSHHAQILRALRDAADVFDTMIYVQIHEDNVFSNCKAGSKLGCRLGVGGGCGNLLESGWQTVDNFTTAESLCFVQLQDSVSGLSRCLIEGNVGDYKSDSSQIDEVIRYANACAAADIIMFETRVDIDARYTHYNAWRPSFEQEMEKRGRKMIFFLGNSYGRSDTANKAERFNRTLAFYYTLIGHRNQQNDSAGFVFAYDGSYGYSANDTLEWYYYQAKYDMGYPSASESTFTKGGTDRGWIRRYEKDGVPSGIAVFHPRTTDGNYDTAAVYLGRTYYQVLDNGTLDPTGTDTCYIANHLYYSCRTSFDTPCSTYSTYWGGTGRIYGTEAGLDSLQQFISNIDSSGTSVTMRDSVVTLYDSTNWIVLFFSSTTTIGDAARQDSVDDVDTAQFQVTGLSQGVTRYYWFEAQDNSHYDTSSMGTIHTLQADTLSQIVTQIDTTTTSFAIYDEIYSNIDPPPDSAELWAGTYKDLDSCIRRDVFRASVEDTLEATGLLSGWIYFYKVIAWDSFEVYSDTTDWDSVRIETEASQQDSFVIDASFISDTYMDDHDRQYNCGGEANFEVGRYYGNPRYALIRAFGIADSLGDDQEMDTACFEITLLSKHAMDTDEWVTFKWFEVLRYWGEGNNTRSTADVGECSWDSAQAGIDAWQIAGCGGATDREAMNENDGIHPDSIRILWNTSNDTTVRLWISLPTIAYWDTSGTNYGIALIMTSESADNHHRARFYSAEHATVAYRPKFIGYKHTLGLAAVIRKIWLIRQ